MHCATRDWLLVAARVGVAIAASNASIASTTVNSSRVNAARRVFSGEREKERQLFMQ
jgi:hypothetical protein